MNDLLPFYFFFLALPSFFFLIILLFLEAKPLFAFSFLIVFEIVVVALTVFISSWFLRKNAFDTNRYLSNPKLFNSSISLILPTERGEVSHANIYKYIYTYSIGIYNIYTHTFTVLMRCTKASTWYYMLRSMIVVFTTT